MQKTTSKIKFYHHYIYLRRYSWRNRLKKAKKIQEIDLMTSEPKFELFQCSFLSI